MSTLKERALANFTKGPGQYQPPDLTVRVYQKITPAFVCDLLDGMHGPNAHKARILLTQMALGPWHIGATAHDGGIAPNAPLHITVFAPRGHHLNCKTFAGDRIYLIDVTAPAR